MEAKILDMKAVVYYGDEPDFRTVNELKRRNIPVFRISDTDDERFFQCVQDLDRLKSVLSRYGFLEGNMAFVCDSMFRTIVGTVFPLSLIFEWSDLESYLALNSSNRRLVRETEASYDVVEYERLMKSGSKQEAWNILRRAITDPIARKELVNQLLKSKEDADHREAFDICTDESSLKIPELVIQTAMFYNKGLVVEKDIDKAISLLESVDLDAFPKTYSVLIALYKERGRPDDVESLLKICSTKCNLLPSLFMEAGKIYNEGKLVDRDINKSISLFEQAVKHKSGFSINNLIDLYIERNGPDDHRKAFELCSKTAESGNPWTIARLGRIYRDGIYVEKDLGKAVDYMASADRSGVKWIKRELLDVLSGKYGKCDRLQDDDCAEYRIDVVKSLERSEDRETYLRGLESLFGGPDDTFARIKYFEEVSKNGIPDIHVLEEANNPADPSICGRMARLYRDGTGVERNIPKAIELFKTAYDKGLDWVMQDYPDVLIDSDDPDNIKEAVRILMRGSLKGLPWCMVKLSRLYSAGIMVPQDMTLAIILMQNAEKAGAKTVGPELRRLERSYGKIYGGLRE